MCIYIYTYIYTYKYIYAALALLFALALACCSELQHVAVSCSVLQCVVMSNLLPV